MIRKTTRKTKEKNNKTTRKEELKARLIDHKLKYKQKIRNKEEISFESIKKREVESLGFTSFEGLINTFSDGSELRLFVNRGGVFLIELRDMNFSCELVVFVDEDLGQYYCEETNGGIIHA